MPADQFILLALLAVSMTGSPGPANTLFMSSGAAYGFRASLPFWLGAFVGFGSVGLVSGFGLTALLNENPLALRAISIVGSLYLFYLAYRIASSNPKEQALDAPFTFYNGLIVHPLNPKAWTMMLAGFSQFAGGGSADFFLILFIVATFLIIAMPLNLAWIAMGSGLGSLMREPGQLRKLNIGLGALLALVALVLMIRPPV